MKNGYLTVADAAKYLNISRSTLDRRVKSQALIPDRVDNVTGYRYFTVQTLQQHKESRYTVKHTINSFEPTSLFLHKFKFIDLFAGIGGIRLGFEKAGGKCVFTSEIDKYAVQTYRHAFPDGDEHILAGDITQIDAKDIPHHHILCGGFPCQPFSIAGVSKYGSLGWKHGFEHPTKGTLFFDILKIIQAHTPKAFFLENVKNLKSHDKGKTWAVIKASLEELGYDVHADIFDAQLLVPQHRERIFIIGFHKTLDINFAFPQIVSKKPKVKDILETESVNPKYTLTDKLWQYLQNYAIRQKNKGNGFGYGLISPDGITRTLSARYYKDGSEILLPQKGKNPRRLTPKECARLQGFPEKFWTPVVSDTQAYKQFGNAVAVPLIEIMAKAMVCTLATAGAFEQNNG